MRASSLDPKYSPGAITVLVAAVAQHRAWLTKITEGRQFPAEGARGYGGLRVGTHPPIYYSGPAIAAEQGAMAQLPLSPRQRALRQQLHERVAERGLSDAGHQRVVPGSHLYQSRTLALAQMTMSQTRSADDCHGHVALRKDLGGN